MNKYLLKLGRILVVVILIIALTACSTDVNTDEENTSSADTSEEDTSAVSDSSDELSGTLTFLSGETDEEQVVIQKEIIADFEALYPNVTVELVLVGYDDREEKILSDLYAGAPVDIVQVDPETICTWANAGILMPLDDLVQDIGEDDFMEGSRVVLDGHDYGMPYSGCSMNLYVRSDLFEEAGLEYPETWDELLTCAEALTTDDMYGICLPAGENMATALWLNMFINNGGGNIFNEDLEPTLDSQEVIDALTFYKELAQYAPPGITSYSYGEQITAFCTGQVAMSIYQGRMIARIASDAPELDEKYDIIDVPTNGIDLQYASYVYYAIGAQSENADLAKAFLKFLCTGENAMKFSMSAPGHLTPALYSVAAMLDTWEDPFLDEGTHREKVKTSFERAAADNTFCEAMNAGGVQGTTFTRNGILNTNFAYARQSNILSTMVQRVLIEDADPAEVCADAQADLEEVIADNQ